MRVLLVSDTPFAGLRHRPQQMALGLARRGHQVVYLEPPSPGDAAAEQAEALANLSVLQLGKLDEDPTGESLREIWATWGRLVAKSIADSTDPEPDVVLCYHPGLLPHLREVCKARIVIDCAEDVEAKSASRPSAEAYRDAMSEGLPYADGLVAINRYIIESWERYLPERAPRAVIEHGVDLDLFKPVSADERRALRAELEMPQSAKMITFLGNCDARVSYEDLLTMIEIDDATRFVFVGEVRPDGLTVFQRLPAERIRPMGPLRADKAALTVSASDVLILPFRREPHLEAVRGLNLYEYLATGLPIVGSLRRALKAYRDLAHLYTTREELIDGFRQALAEPADAEVRKARLDVARGAAWDGRVGELESYLQDILAV